MDVRHLRQVVGAWLVLVPLMIGNAGFRELVLARILAPSAAHIASSVTGILVIIVFTAAFFRWTTLPFGTRARWLMGGTWAGLTFLFETGLTLFVRGGTWADVVATYDVPAGQAWVFVLLTTLLAPVVVDRVR